MVLFDETKRKERRRLEVEQIKRLTGSRRVRAHFMRQDEFDFEITSTFILLSNNLPAVEDSSNGIWDRLKLVVCRHRIADQLAKLGRRPDEDVGLKLRAELPGILNFMVQGCRLWREEGLGAPVDVLQATTDYKRQANSVLSWRDDVLAAGGEMLANLARKSYEVYCQHRGLVPVRRTDFKMELKQAGMECTRPDGKPLRDAQGRHQYAGYSLPFAEVERLHREGGADDGGADAAN
jgi:putative DNA primase/helicase